MTSRAGSSRFCSTARARRRQGTPLEGQSLHPVSAAHGRPLEVPCPVMVSLVLLLSAQFECHGRVVMMQEQEQTHPVHLVRLAERERLPDETRQTLPQRVVEALDMVGLAAALAAGDVLVLRDHLLVRLPKVGERHRSAQSRRDALPQQAARLLAPVANSVGDNLACAAAQRQPDPTLVLLSCSCAGRQTTRVGPTPGHRQPR